MFEKFSNIIEGKFAGPLEKLSNQRHLRAIRDGIIATLPIIIVSSLLMVVAFSYNQMPESWALAKFVNVYYDIICSFWNWLFTCKIL